jgi:cell division protein FtsN
LIRGGLLLLCLLFLQGCFFLPIHVRVASWALNGLSYATTQKSLTDHVVSEATHKDCATWRVLKGESVCHDEEPAPVAVAAADETLIEPVGGPEEEGQAAVAEAIAGNELGAFETAAGDAGAAVGFVAAPKKPEQPIADTAKRQVRHAQPVDADNSALPSMAEVKPARTESTDLISEILTAFVIPPRKPEPALEDAVIEPVLVAADTALHETAEPGLYYVIGSFADLDNAQSAQARFRHLGSAIVSAELDGRSLYRVTVGPFEKSAQRTTRRMLTRAGIYDAWAIRLDASDWVVAMAADGHNDIAELQK